MGVRAIGFNGRRLATLAAALAAAALAGCAQPRQASAPVAQAPTAPAVPQAGAGVRVDPRGPAPVALLLPLSASDRGAAAAARDMADAARLALQQAPGQIALEVRDTGGTPAGAVSAARAARTGGAALILGPLYGAGAEAAGEAVSGSELNLVSFSNTPSVAGGNIWLIGRMADTEAERIIGHAAREGRRRIGLYYPDTALGRVARAAAEDAAARRGAVLGPVMAYPRSFEGIRDSAESYAEAHKAAGAQAVLLPDSGQGLQAAASFLRYHDVGTGRELMLGLGDWGAPALARESALDKGRFAAPDPDRLAAFADRFQAEYGRRPDALAWLGYDAAAAAAQMMQTARREGDDRPFGAEDLLDPGGFEGAAGRFRFTEDGRNRRALAVVEIGPDGFRVIEPAPAVPGGAGGV